MNNLKILWYNIKFYNKNNQFIKTITESSLLNKINFWETINNWQWILDIYLKQNFFYKEEDIFSVKVFFLINIDNDMIEEHIYTWILDEIYVERSSKIVKVRYSFLWLYKFYIDIENFKIETDWTNYFLEKEYEENNTNLFFTQDLIYKSLWFTEIQVDLIWDFPWIGKTKVKWVETWYEADLIYINTTWENDFIWIYKQNWKFNIWERLDLLEYNFSTNEYEVVSNFQFEVKEYRTWDNISNYHLNFSTDNIEDNGFQNFKISNQNNASVLTSVLEKNENFFYFVDKKWDIILKNKENTEKRMITFNKEINRLEWIKNNSFYNYITVKNDIDEIVVFDKESIEKNWKKQKTIIDKNILDIDTLLKRGNFELNKYINWWNEICLEVNIAAYLSFVEKTWDDMIKTWESYEGIKIKDLKEYLGTYSIFSINIWDKLTINNIEEEMNRQLVDLTVVRKEFDGNFMKIYLWDYKNNYFLLEN